jgi:hypothetical protein
LFPIDAADGGLIRCAPGRDIPSIVTCPAGTKLNVFVSGEVVCPKPVGS